MNLAEGISKAIDGDAILFVGAGYSLDAINYKGTRLKNARELAKHFSNLSGISEDISLEDAAEVYQEKFGIDSLIEEIKKEYTVKSVSNYHNEIVQIPWKRIYTTNYDNVIEKSFSNINKYIIAITLKQNIRDIPKTSTLCVHLNGYIETLDRKSIFTELKLTESSYVTTSINDSSWAITFRQDIRLARSIFFIGYSAYDLDIKRILAQSDAIKQKTFFFIGPKPDSSTARRCSLFGNVFKETALDFSQKVYDVKKEYEAPRKDIFLPVFVKEYTPKQTTQRIKDRDFLDLLLYGKRNEDLIYKSLTTNKKYYLKRSFTNDVFKHISNGEKIIVISSELGNGKSLFIDGLRLMASEKGYRVFELTEQNDLTLTELEKISKLEDPVFLIIENYHNWFDEIKLYLDNCNSESVLVLTTRNAINDISIDKLTNISNVDFIPEIQIDEMVDKEIIWFIETFEEYGLWGENAGKSRNFKKNLIATKYNNQIHALLLDTLNSPDISSRLETITNDLKEDDELFKISISIFILTVLNFRISFDSLADLWNSEVINSGKFRRNGTINELIDFSTNSISIRSPILAEYFLRNLTSAGYIIDTLIIIAQKVDKASRYSLQYRSLSRDLMRFHSLQLILPDEGKKAAVIKYYESIKNLYNCKNNPLFWLQYAIASLVIEDIFRAKKYFDTAYSLAEARDWDTFQIDNHFARFLLLESFTLQVDGAMKNFKEAHKIINRQIRKERRHYPYRVALLYQDFFDKFVLSLSSKELNDIKRSSLDIYNRIQELPKNRGAHKYVKKCNEVMIYMLDRINSILSAKK